MIRQGDKQFKTRQAFPGLRPSYEQALEFYAGNAFLLGMHTGAGLSAAWKE